MGFWDNVKNITGKIVDKVEESYEIKASQMTNEQLIDALNKYPNNKYIRNEAEKRRLI
jgi:hypothetical protein